MLIARKERPRVTEAAPAKGWRRTAPAVVEPPIRSQLFSVSQLEQHATALAGWHELSPASENGPDRLLPRLTANEVALREAHALVTEAVKRGAQITPAAEWFIDNYHLIEEQIRTARRHLPRGYSRELPRLGNALVGGHAARLRSGARADLALARAGRRRRRCARSSRRTRSSGRSRSASCGRSRSCCGWR